MIFAENDGQPADGWVRPCKNKFGGIKKITLRTYRQLNDCLNAKGERLVLVLNNLLND
jgi:hypothetical protein